MTATVIGNTFQAVLFDMDGTLIHSTPAVRRSWAKWGAERGLPVDFRKGGHGQPARDIVASFVPEEEFEAAFARIVEIEVAEVDDITVLPGAAEALAAIPRERKAIVTSCTRALAEARIRASQIVAPEVVVTADDVSNGKPDPEPFAYGAKLLGFDPAQCLIIEDAHAGLLSGKAAGCATLAVAGTHQAADLTADLVVDSLADLRFEAVDGGVRVIRCG